MMARKTPFQCGRRLLVAYWLRKGGLKLDSIQIKVHEKSAGQQKCWSAKVLGNVANDYCITAQAGQQGAE
jgi:hypothetical protein